MNVAADRTFRMRLRRNGDSVLAAELKALGGPRIPEQDSLNPIADADITPVRSHNIDAGHIRCIL